MNQERPSDVPYSVSDAGCLVFRNGRGVVNFDSRRDAINAASLANRSHAEGRKSTEKELDKMKEELEVANRLLEGRDRLLDLFECKDHGQGCVPDAVEKVIKMQKDFQELLEFTSRKCYRDGDRADFIAWKKARGLK